MLLTKHHGRWPQATHIVSRNKPCWINEQSHTTFSSKKLRYASLRKRFPCSDCVGCIYERKRLLVTDCVGVLTTGNDFACIIVFLALLYVLLYLSARRSHTTSFCRACVPGGHIPNGFWVVWEGPPYRPHSLGDNSECRRGKGLNPVCLGLTRTSGATEEVLTKRPKTCKGTSSTLEVIKPTKERNKKWT